MEYDQNLRVLPGHVLLFCEISVQSLKFGRTYTVVFCSWAAVRCNLRVRSSVIARN